MLYNSTRTNAGAVMPLLMGCTPISRIEEADANQKAVYDPLSQRTYDARVVGTYSMKVVNTKAVGTNVSPDKKNQIDDQKNVR